MPCTSRRWGSARFPSPFRGSAQTLQLPQQLPGQHASAIDGGSLELSPMQSIAQDPGGDPVMPVRSTVSELATVYSMDSVGDVIVSAALTSSAHGLLGGPGVPSPQGLP